MVVVSRNLAPLAKSLETLCTCGSIVCRLCDTILQWIFTSIHAALFTAVETYLAVDWFHHPIALAAFPHVLVLTASRHTRLCLRCFLCVHPPQLRRPQHYHLHVWRCVLVVFTGGDPCRRPSLKSSPSKTTPLLPTEQPEPINEIDKFLQGVDVLSHHHVLQSCLTKTILLQCAMLSNDNPQCKRILLEAKGLQTNLRSHKEKLPLQNPTVHVSTKMDDLPMVIDTRALCSVTP